jgi:predicted DNA-binding protein with PD1-like motif
MRTPPERSKHALLHEDDGMRTFVVICQSGQEAVAALTAFASEQNLAGSQVTAIGAFSSAVVGYFDWSAKKYKHIAIDEQVEVLSFIGDIALDQNRPKLHAHVVLGKADGTAHGGHLLEGHVRPTLEVIVTETPRHLRRRFDPASGIALIDPAAAPGT